MAWLSEVIYRTRNVCIYCAVSHDVPYFISGKALSPPRHEKALGIINGLGAVASLVRSMAQRRWSAAHTASAGHGGNTQIPSALHAACLTSSDSCIPQPAPQNKRRAGSHASLTYCCCQGGCLHWNIATVLFTVFRTPTFSLLRRVRPESASAWQPGLVLCAACGPAQYEDLISSSTPDRGC